MRATKTVPTTPLPPTMDERTAAVAVVDAIQQAEETMQVTEPSVATRCMLTNLSASDRKSHTLCTFHPQRGLETTYCKLTDEGYRNLRMKLPVSKQRMDWSAGAKKLVPTKML